MVSISLTVGIFGVLFAFLSWRAATATTLEENETILHQRYGDANEEGGKKQRGDYHQVKIYSLRTWPEDDFWSPFKTYLLGQEPGAVEMNVIFDSSPPPESVNQYEDHPWYSEVNFTVAKLAKNPEDIAGTATATIIIFTPVADDVQQQLKYFHEITDHIVASMTGKDSDPIPDEPQITIGDEVSKMSQLQSQ